MENASPRDEFLSLLQQALSGDGLIKLTLAKPKDPKADCRNLFVRPVKLKTGPCLSLVWRYRTRDVTKNLPTDETFAQLNELIGPVFLDAHLYTSTESLELRCTPEGRDRLIRRAPQPQSPKRSEEHNRTKVHLIAPRSPWLHALGITNERGEPRTEMAPKYRQIQKYAELLRHLLAESGLWPVDQTEAPALKVVDMGAGKGYLTFAVAALLGPKSEVIGVERREDLVLHGNDVSRTLGMTQLRFVLGNIAEAPLEAIDVLIALHACDTATDEALFRGIQAQAKLLVAAPCCQKELRRQLRPAPVLELALRHGIFRERQAEFVTDALRAEFLAWAGYRSRVFEFIATEHTAKNLMIAGIAGGEKGSSEDEIRALASFYGIEHHRLAELLGFALHGGPKLADS